MSLRPKRELSATPTPVSRLDQVLTVGKQNPKTTAPRPIKTEPPAAPEEPVGANFFYSSSVDSTEGITRLLDPLDVGSFVKTTGGPTSYASLRGVRQGIGTDDEVVGMGLRNMKPDYATMFANGLTYNGYAPPKGMDVVTRRDAALRMGKTYILRRMENSKGMFGAEWTANGVEGYSGFGAGIISPTSLYRDDYQKVLAIVKAAGTAPSNHALEAALANEYIYYELPDDRRNQTAYTVGANAWAETITNEFKQATLSNTRLQRKSYSNFWVFLKQNAVEGMPKHQKYLCLGRWSTLDYVRGTDIGKRGYRYLKLGMPQDPYPATFGGDRRLESVRYNYTAYDRAAADEAARALLHLQGGSSAAAAGPSVYSQQALNPTLPVDPDNESEWDTDDDTPLSEMELPGGAGPSGTTEALEAGVEAMRVAL